MSSYSSERFITLIESMGLTPEKVYAKYSMLRVEKSRERTLAICTGIKRDKPVTPHAVAEILQRSIVPGDSVSEPAFRSRALSRSKKNAMVYSWMEGVKVGTEFTHEYPEGSMFVIDTYRNYITGAGSCNVTGSWRLVRTVSMSINLRTTDPSIEELAAELNVALSDALREIYLVLKEHY